MLIVFWCTIPVAGQVALHMVCRRRADTLLCRGVRTLPADGPASMEAPAAAGVLSSFCLPPAESGGQHADTLSTQHD